MDNENSHLKPGQEPEAGAADEFRRQKVQRLEQELSSCRQRLRHQEEELYRLRRQLAGPTAQPEVREGDKHHKLIARILETSPAAIVMINPQGRVTFANSQGVNFMGLRQDKQASRNSRDPGWIFTDFAGQTILKEDSPLVKVLADQRPIYQVPIALQHFDGRRRYYLVNGAPMFDGNGHLEGAVISAEDITPLKQTEEALNAAHARLEHLIAASSAVIYSCQAIPPYTPTYISENIKDILGYPTYDFLHIHNLWSDNIHPEDAPRVLSALACLGADKRLSLEYRFRRRDGDYLWMQDEMTLVDSRSGPPEIVGFWVDISQRKQTEQVLRETQDRLATLINSTPDPIFFKDTQGRYLMINQAYQRGDWFQEIDWYGKTDEELFPPQIARIFRKSDAKIVSERGSAVVEYALNNPEGKKVFYQTIKFPLFDGQGEVIGIGGIARDITARKEVEQLLKRSEANLQALFDTVQDFIWILDKKGRFLRVNSVFLERLGYSQEELTGQNIQTVLPLDCREQSITIMADLLAGKIDECSLPLQAQDGTQIPVETKATRGQWFGTEVFIGISRDVTVRRQLEAQLIKSAKVASLGVMAGGIAHEIRSPLTVCSSAAQFLLEENLDVDFRRLCLEKMLGGIAQASAIVENLLKFARTPEKLEIALINLPEIIQDSLTLITSQARRQNVELRQIMPPGTVTCYAMPGLLTQAFLNLFLNALKAMPDGGCLTISLTADERGAAICIADTGHGIAAADLPNIFDPFYTTKGVGQGTGLGLAICQSFIKQHHGSIEVESNLGQGARFIVRLPLAPVTPDRPGRQD